VKLNSAPIKGVNQIMQGIKYNLPNPIHSLPLKTR
jgi:hypothetical protein